MTGKVIEFILSPLKSALDGLITYDWINVNLLKKCMNSTLLEDSLEWDETKQLKKYMSKYNKSDKKYLVPVLNARPKGLNYGRVVPQNNLGLSHVRREIRPAKAVSKPETSPTEIPARVAATVSNKPLFLSDSDIVGGSSFSKDPAISSPIFLIVVSLKISNALTPFSAQTTSKLCSCRY